MPDQPTQGGTGKPVCSVVSMIRELADKVEIAAVRNPTGEAASTGDKDSAQVFSCTHFRTIAARALLQVRMQTTRRPARKQLHRALAAARFGQTGKAHSCQVRSHQRRLGHQGGITRNP